MLGLNRAAASKEYSCRKYAPTSWRCVWLKQAWGANNSCMPSPRALERRHQIAMAILKVLQYLGQLAAGGFGVECEHPIDDVIARRPVSAVEFSRLGRRLEWSQHHSRGVRTQLKGLAH